jgi:hypothetical protein
MTAMIALPVPPAFDPKMWEEHTDARPGPNYKGISFSFDIVDWLIQADDETEDRLTIHGTEVTVQNLQLTTDPRENYPLYFECDGQTYHYVVSCWTDRTTIQVCQKNTGNEENVDPDAYKVLSTMFPTTDEELSRALSTMVNDHLSMVFTAVIEADPVVLYTHFAQL